MLFYVLFAHRTWNRPILQSTKIVSWKFWTLDWHDRPNSRWRDMWLRGLCVHQLMWILHGNLFINCFGNAFQMVSGSGNYAQLDALQSNGRHLVGWLHHGRAVDRPDAFPGNRSYPFLNDNELFSGSHKGQPIDTRSSILTNAYCFICLISFISWIWVFVFVFFCVCTRYSMI